MSGLGQRRQRVQRVQLAAAHPPRGSRVFLLGTRPRYQIAAASSVSFAVLPFAFVSRGESKT